MVGVKAIFQLCTLVATSIECKNMGVCQIETRSISVIVCFCRVGSLSIKADQRRALISSMRQEQLFLQIGVLQLPCWLVSRCTHQGGTNQTLPLTRVATQ